MRSGTLRFRRCLCLLVLLFFAAAAAAPPQTEGASGDCPDLEHVRSLASRVFPKEAEIRSVQPAPVSGWCEVQVLFKGQQRIFYVDKDGAFFFLGEIIDVERGVNLTRRATEAGNRFTAEEMKKLEDLAALRLGDQEPVVYLATDPQCPYCARAEKILEDMAQNGDLSAKILFFPLASHKGAKELCISVICDKKGMHEFRSGYQSDNQCDEGRRLIEETVGFLSSKGIAGTPAYIFPDGTYHLGVMSKERLLQRLKE